MDFVCFLSDCSVQIVRHDLELFASKPLIEGFYWIVCYIAVLDYQFNEILQFGRNVGELQLIDTFLDWYVSR